MKKLLILLLATAVFSLVLAACSSSETPTPIVIEKEVIKEVPVVKEVVREVEKRVIQTVVVEKQVVVHTVEVPVIATPPPRTSTGGRRGGTLSVVAQASAGTMDPTFTAGVGTATPTRHIFEQLFSWNVNAEPQPELAGEWSVNGDVTLYTIKLRDNIIFHNGAAVTADDVIPSINRWSEVNAGGKLTFDFLAEGGLTKIDDKTIQVRFKEPFGVLFEALAGQPRSSNIYLQKAAEFPSSEDFGEENAIGTAPYFLSRWERGNKIVLERFEAYIARNEEPNLWAGGKQAFLDRIEFLEVPAAESKIAGLRTGQFDVVLNAPLSFFEILRDDTNIEISTPLGNFATIDINASLPPTENVLARQAILAATNIEDFMDALSPKELWFPCSSRYVCGTVWESTAGMDEFYDQNDLPKAQQLLKDSGYAGEPLVLWAPTDNQVLTDIGVVAAPMLEAIGFTVEFPAQDWATLVSKLGDGTWNIIADFWGVGFRGSPLRDPMVAGTFINSFVSPKMQQLQLDLIKADSLEEQQKLVDEINLAFFEEVPTVSFGQFKLIYPHRTSVRGLQQVALPSFYNAWLDE